MTLVSIVTLQGLEGSGHLCADEQTARYCVYLAEELWPIQRCEKLCEKFLGFRTDELTEPAEEGVTFKPCKPHKSIARAPR